MVAGKLPLVPRYRQKVRFVPLQLGRPVWVDDPHFNLGYHVRHTALPPPGRRRASCARLVGRVMSQQLDRTKPLWEMWMVEGLEDGHWALLSKTHHCMVDGVSGTDLLTVVLDHDPEPPPPEPDDWQPSRAAVGRPTLAADALVERGRQPLRAAPRRCGPGPARPARLRRPARRRRPGRARRWPAWPGRRPSRRSTAPSARTGAGTGRARRSPT